MLDINMGFSDIKKEIARTKKDATALNDSISEAYRMNWDSPYTIMGLEDKINVSSTIVDNDEHVTVIDITFETNGVCHWMQHRFDTVSGKCYTNDSLFIRNTVTEINL